MNSRLTALLFSFLLGLTAWGQAGTVIGTVSDEQGAVIPAADIKLVEASTGSSRSASTNDVGRFTLVNVPPGTYTVTVTKPGFQTSKVTDQKVEIGEVLTVNVPLKVGTAATTVEVSATAGAELQTLNATIGSTITNDSLQLLPNLGRDASSLSVLQVGVSLSGNVAGAAIDQNKFKLDGGNNSDDMAGGNTTYTPGNGYSGTAATGGTPTGVIPTPIESIEEIKVGTSGQSADFSGAAGSEVQMATKRGTNQFHGALYEFYFGSNVGAANLWRNNHVLVNDPKNPGTKIATPLPATHRNRYGFAVGGPMTPKFWGGKSFFFVNSEASKFPHVISVERGGPTDLMKAGVIQLTDTTGKVSAYNLNPYAVTVNGKTYDPATCGTGPCDPRGIGLNPVVRKLWNTLPSPNDASFTAGSAATGLVDGINAQGYLGNLALPQSSTFLVGRVDHDFGEKWKFMASYRYYKFTQLAGTQVDLGGLLPGATQGQYKSFAPRPVQPSYWVAGMTTTITPNLTNDFRFSYLRNFWQWSTQSGPPQFAGLGGAVEIGGESQGGGLIPYNVDSQDVRQRFWDGHDYFLSDSMSLLKGNHLFQWGGSYQRINDLHGRDDNGVGINTSLVYQLAGGSAVNSSGYTLPNGAAAGGISNYPIMYNEIMGLVTQTQLMYSRSGKNLQLNPIGTPGFDQSIIPSFDAYFTDTWHVKPNLTISYGLGWGASLPPYEVNGKQVLMVDAAGNPIDIKGYLKNRQNQALQGQVYNPQIGFETINNVQGGQVKYPFNPFYGGFSPKVSAAWNPRFAPDSFLTKIFGNGQTVIRGGYGRIYGRLNGVDLLLVPLLGPGLLQAVSCVGVTIDGKCAGSGGTSPATGFRIGTDGNSPPVPSATATLPQPYYPGTTQNGILNSTAADGSQLDPKLRPNHSDAFNFTIQRQINAKIVVEAGYIGRTIKNEFQEINIDPIPWMTTLNGQNFAQAWSGVYNQICAGAGPQCTPNTANVAVQPFFEAALGGASSVYCAGFANCTAAVVSKQVTNIKGTNAYNAWVALSQANGWTLGRTLLAQPGAGQQLSGAFDFINSYGHGSYNAAFFSLTAKDWHGLTTRSNFTWGRSLGTGSVVQASSSITVPNPYDFENFGTYGTQPFDVKFTYSVLMLYQPPVFKAQKGVIGKMLGGWAIAPLFTARTGLPQRVSVGSNYGAFGEIYSGQSSNYENAPLLTKFTGTGQAAYNVAIPSGGVASSGTTGVNLFSDPLAVYNEFRRPVLGFDQNSGGAGPIRGFPFWNLDATVSKDFRIRESIGATLNFQFVNVLNHFVPADPTTNIDTPSSFGVVTSQFTTPNGASSRSMEFGLRIRF